MNRIASTSIPWGDLAKSPLAWSVVLGALALILLMPGTSRRLRQLGLVVGAFALVSLAAGLAPIAGVGARVTFWVMGGLTVVAAAATIASRSPVYSAIWFAVSLLGTAGLFMMQNAQFLSVATVVVYAGAIVVTLLFVVMLAQPEGHDTYDRISWGPLAKPAVIVTVALLAGTLVGSLAGVRNLDPQGTRTGLSRGSMATVTGGGSGAKSVNAKSASATGPDSSSHMALLGSELFSRHLIAVEVAGTLLLVALVGAVAIVIQGRDGRGPREGGSDG